MQAVRSNRYFPKLYYQVQCFVTDENVKDILKLRFCPTQEGDTSVVLAVPKRKIETFMELAIKHGVYCAVKSMTDSKIKPIKLEPIIDTLKFD